MRKITFSNVLPMLFVLLIITACLLSGNNALKTGEENLGWFTISMGLMFGFYNLLMSGIYRIVDVYHGFMAEANYWFIRTEKANGKGYTMSLEPLPKGTLTLFILSVYTGFFAYFFKDFAVFSALTALISLLLFWKLIGFVISHLTKKPFKEWFVKYKEI